MPRLESATARLQDATPAEAGAAATDYLRLFALVSFGWMCVRMAAAAAPLGHVGTRSERRKPVLARFFVERMLPQTAALHETVGRSAAATMALLPDDL